MNIDTHRLLISLIFISGLALFSCAAELTTLDNEEPDMAIMVSSELIIDSTSSESWVYLDLDSYLDDPESTQQSLFDDVESAAGWDIAFQRYKVMSNGGISGAGNVSIAIIKDQDFDMISQAPSEGYQVDEEDSEADEDTDPDYVFNRADAWYAYDFNSHTLSTKNYTYVVKTTQGNYFKIAIDDYYNLVGDAGYLTIRVESITAP